MILRKATPADRAALCELYELVCRTMEEKGMRTWHWGAYPSEKNIEEDIAAGLCYCLYGTDGMTIAVTVDPNPTRPGSEQVDIGWLFGVRPGTFHRLAVRPGYESEDKGIVRQAIEDVKEILRLMECDAMRATCGKDNDLMVRMYAILGMRQAGRGKLSRSRVQYLLYETPLTLNCPLLPVHMNPAFRGGSLTPWGGKRLLTSYEKEIRDIPTGESLEVSCIPDLGSKSDNGVPLRDMIKKYGSLLVGKYDLRPFPLLLKLIDAKQALSVQVHPDDAYAAANEYGKQGKTEAWLILEAPKDAELVYGIKPGTTKEELRAACEQGEAVEPLLRRVKVQPGDVCFIPAGCVHAIGAGIMLYEIQQSSDITYRFYDWNRTDAEGKRRELHLEKALDVTDLSFAPDPVRAPEGEGCARVLDTEFFTLDLLQSVTSLPMPKVRDFGMVTALTEGLTLRWESSHVEMKKGDTFLLPATCPALTLEGAGKAAVSMPK